MNTNISEIPWPIATALSNYSETLSIRERYLNTVALRILAIASPGALHEKQGPKLNHNAAQGGSTLARNQNYISACSQA